MRAEVTVTTEAGADARRSLLLNTMSVLVSTRERISASSDGYVVASNRHILMSELANLHHKPTEIQTAVSPNGRVRKRVVSVRAARQRGRPLFGQCDALFLDLVFRVANAGGVGDGEGVAAQIQRHL